MSEPTTDLRQEVRNAPKGSLVAYNGLVWRLTIHNPISNRSRLHPVDAEVDSKALPGDTLVWLLEGSGPVMLRECRGRDVWWGRVYRWVKGTGKSFRWESDDQEMVATMNSLVYPIVPPEPEEAAAPTTDLHKPLRDVPLDARVVHALMLWRLIYRGDRVGHLSQDDSRAVILADTPVLHLYGDKPRPIHSLNDWWWDDSPDHSRHMPARMLSRDGNTVTVEGIDGSTWTQHARALVWPIVPPADLVLPEVSAEADPDAEHQRLLRIADGVLSKREPATPDGSEIPDGTWLVMHPAPGVHAVVGPDGTTFDCRDEHKARLLADHLTGWTPEPERPSWLDIMDEVVTLAGGSAPRDVLDESIPRMLAAAGYSAPVYVKALDDAIEWLRLVVKRGRPDERAYTQASRILDVLQEADRV